MLKLWRKHKLLATRDRRKRCAFVVMCLPSIDIPLNYYICYHDSNTRSNYSDRVFRSPYFHRLPDFQKSGHEYVFHRESTESLVFGGFRNDRSIAFRRNFYFRSRKSCFRRNELFPDCAGVCLRLPGDCKSADAVVLQAQCNLYLRIPEPAFRDCEIGKHTSELQSQFHLVCRLL